MDKIEIEYLYEKATYSQAYSSGVKMTAVSDKNEQVKPFFFCADFFNEMFGAMITNSKKGIYKFDFDPATDINPSMSKVRVLITSDSHNLSDKVNEGKKFLNEFEKKVGLSPSEFYFCSEHKEYKDNVILVDADPRIKNTPLLLTAWRVALRNSFASNIDEDFDESLNKMIKGEIEVLGHGDESAISKLKSFIDYVTKNDKEFIDYFDIKNYEINVHKLHSSSGLTQFSSVISNNHRGAEAPWEERVLSKLKIS